MEENNSSYVIDSSFILAHFLPDETSNNVQKFFDRLKKEPIILVAPYIFPFEVFNGIQTAVIRKRITVNLAKKLGEKFLKLAVKLEEVNLLKVASIAQSQSLTIYDASYVYLAENLNIPFLTLDEKLLSIS